MLLLPDHLVTCPPEMNFHQLFAETTLVHKHARSHSKGNRLQSHFSCAAKCPNTPPDVDKLHFTPQKSSHISNNQRTTRSCLVQSAKSSGSKESVAPTSTVVSEGGVTINGSGAFRSSTKVMAPSSLVPFFRAVMTRGQVSRSAPYRTACRSGGLAPNRLC